jgi:RNA polymerase sigma-54 factor
MATRNRITIAQTQRLSLNTRLLTSIRFLEADALGLGKFLEEAAAANPQLVLAPPPPAEWLPRWNDAFARMARGIAAGGATGLQAAEMADTAGPSLIAHVEAFLAGLHFSAADHRIAQGFVEALEPSGWLGQPVARIAAEAGVPVERAEAILTRLQTIEPTGLFARDLAECLRLQAAAEGWLDPLATAVLANLALVAAASLDRLTTRTGASVEQVRAVIRRIRQLDPKPGAQFSHCAAPIREPDLVARRGAAGWEVALNRSALPTITLAEVPGKGRAAARSLITLIEGRNATLLRVATEILARQASALDEGPGALQPLTMAEVADALGLNQSTVSRVVAGAAVDTPRGTWWLRMMFSQAIRGVGPSAASLREAISRMVAAEEAATPLSDGDLAAALAGAGAPVARRTVAKYREMLGIPPAHARRKGRRKGRGWE